MSHIISVRFVNLQVKVSFIALAMNSFLLFIFAWAVILMDIPLILSVYLLMLMFKQHQIEGFIDASSDGYWCIDRDGVVHHQNRTLLLIQTDLSTAGLKVSFKLDHGQKVTIWRDSCHDNDYRHLCLVLRQWDKGVNTPFLNN
ncbi:protein YgfX [Vibrio sagamiensis]|uniref:protein YgfX n=1 Tax=Vibrio sagamiensis TaxID=512650 RepID=UPI001FD594D6|nr:protein YgfX [Vibrio sagamiensis]